MFNLFNISSELSVKTCLKILMPILLLLSIYSIYGIKANLPLINALNFGNLNPATTPILWNNQNHINKDIVNPVSTLMLIGDMLQPTVENKSTIIIDTFSVAASRVDVNSTQTISLHAKWKNDTNISYGLIYVEGVEHKTNSSGWLTFNVTISNVGKTTWRVTAVNCSGVYGFEQTAPSLYIIWDRVNVLLSIKNARINEGSKAEVHWNATYEYDNSQFQGRIKISEPNFGGVGQGHFDVDFIYDNKYGLSAFKSNKVICVWDRIKIIQGGVSNQTTKIGNLESVWFKAVYEFDKEEFTGDKGSIYVDDLPMTWSSLDKAWKYSTKLDAEGMLTFKVSKVEDSKYGLTKFIDAVGPQSITWEKPSQETHVGIANTLAILAIVTAVLALIAVVRILFLMKKS